MQKYGKVISIFKDKNNLEKIEIILDNSKIENSCSIKYSEDNCINMNKNEVHNCETCGGCGAGKNRTGLLAISGNRITAINKTNKKIKLGDIVQINIDNSKIKMQTNFSILVPIMLAIIFAICSYLIFKIEIASIIGTFLGLTTGAIISLFLNKKLGNKIFPEII